MTCTVFACSRRGSHRGWCPAHYNRWRRHGDPTGGGPSKPTSPQVKLDASPLVDAITRRVESFQGAMTSADRRAFYRARNRGWVGEQIADRLAVRYCGLLLEELYGWDYEGAA